MSPHARLYAPRSRLFVSMAQPICPRSRRPCPESTSRMLLGHVTLPRGHVANAPWSRTSRARRHTP
eukprot:1851464-Rhodomonas_salina.2